MGNLPDLLVIAGNFIRFAGIIVALVGVACLFLAFFKHRFGAPFENALMLTALGALMNEAVSLQGILGVLSVLVWKFARRGFFPEADSAN